MTEEFYELTDTGFDLPGPNQALLKWEEVYNAIQTNKGYSHVDKLKSHS